MSALSEVKPNTRVHHHEVVDDDFERGELLGQGSYAVVTRAIYRPTSSQVALKRISLRLIHKFGEQIRVEINTHRRLRHMHIVRLLSYYFTQTELVLVLELCAKGSLRDRLHQMGKFSERRASRYLRQTARAIQYLHEMGLAHRDVKLENILLDKNGVVKLADFGWCREMCEGRTTVCGTLDYLSPEMLAGDGNTHSTKTDVWSLGIVLNEMLTGTTPFFHPSEKETLTSIRFDAPTIPSNISESCKDLIVRMLQKNPEDRLSIDEVLNHPWTSHDKNVDL